MDNECELYAMWAYRGIQQLRPDLTEEQALEVLDMVLQNNSEDISLCFDTLEMWADAIFPRRAAALDTDELEDAAVLDGVGEWYG
jgi:hypothetical protein